MASSCSINAAAKRSWIVFIREAAVGAHRSMLVKYFCRIPSYKSAHALVMLRHCPSLVVCVPGYSSVASSSNHVTCTKPTVKCKQKCLDTRNRLLRTHRHTQTHTIDKRKNGTHARAVRRAVIDSPYIPTYIYTYKRRIVSRGFVRKSNDSRSK